MLSNQAKVNLILGFLLVLILANLVILDWRIFAKKEQELEVIPLPTPTITPTPTLVPTPTLIPISTAPLRRETHEQEFFISLGGAQTNAKEWENLVGLEAFIDRAKYGKIRRVVFEVGIVVPNGNQKAWVRLYNKTDNWPIVNSELIFAGGEKIFLVSSPLNLLEGNKLYGVQAKTEFGYPATINQAKIKITAQIE